MDRVDPILALLLSPFILSGILLIALAVLTVARIDRAHSIERARREATRRSLAYLTDPAEIEHVRQVVAAATAKARLAESPANQREAAPWFDGESA